MPMTVAYTNFGGQLIHENRGGTESFFTADPLGSIVDVRNSSGTQTFSATYWPYGEIRTSTGTNPSQFDFVGSLGYYRENSARTYVRARFLRKELARWMTVDLLWPEELAYAYASQSPAEMVDPSGLQGYSGQKILDCAYELVRKKKSCSYDDPDPDSGFACVQVWSHCAPGFYDDLPKRCPGHGSRGRNCARSIADVCNELKRQGVWHDVKKGCSLGDMICFAIGGYGKSPCGGHCGVVSRVNGKGFPTHVIMCSEQCVPKDTVCEVEIHSWLEDCRRRHGGVCFPVGCGGTK